MAVFFLFCFVCLFVCFLSEYLKYKVWLVKNIYTQILETRRFFSAADRVYPGLASFLLTALAMKHATSVARVSLALPGVSLWEKSHGTGPRALVTALSRPCACSQLGVRWFCKELTCRRHITGVNCFRFLIFYLLKSCPPREEFVPVT